MSFADPAAPPGISRDADRPAAAPRGWLALLHAGLRPFPVACFTLTLLTDIAYWQTSNLMWQNFSSWLLFAGLALGGLALLVGLVRLVLARPGIGWASVLLDIAVLAFAFLNSLIHAGDGWTAVVPWGLAVSALTVLLLVVAGLLRHPASPYGRTRP